MPCRTYASPLLPFSFSFAMPLIDCQLSLIIDIIDAYRCATHYFAAIIFILLFRYTLAPRRALFSLIITPMPFSLPDY
jgi:hypothetical protein